MSGDSVKSNSWKTIKTRFPFDLCLAAEEIGSDFARVIAAARSTGIDSIEFGSLWGGSIDVVPFGRLVRARDMLKDSGLQVRMVATQAFKTVYLGSTDTDDITLDPHYRSDLELFNSAVEAAKFFNAPLVRAFSFRREHMTGLGNPSKRSNGGGAFPDHIVERVAAGLTPAMRLAEDAGVVVALENVRSCWCDSGANTATLLEFAKSDSLRTIWDPANAYVSGEEDAVVAGYKAVKPFICHVHIKDAVVEDPDLGLTRWERIGDGNVGLSAQCKALYDDRYDGCVSIETHWSPPDSDSEVNTRRTYEGLITLLEDF